MVRSEAASYWADTASGYFESMAPGQKQPAAAPAEQVAGHHRHKLPPLAVSPSILAAIDACARRREAGTESPPVSLPPTKALVSLQEPVATVEQPCGRCYAATVSPA